VCAGRTLNVGFLEEVQAKLSLAVPTGGKGNAWGRQEELGLLLLLLPGDPGGGIVSWEALSTEVVAAACRQLSLPAGTTMGLQAQTGALTGLLLDWVCYFLLAREDRLIYFQQIDRA